MVAAAPEGAEVQPFLDALAADGALLDGDIEIIIMHSGACAGARPEKLVVVSLDAPCSIFELWGAGVRTARAPAIALLDVRCPPVKGWLSAVRARLPLSVPAIFGPVACGVDVRSPDVVGYLVEYAQFAPPLDPHLSETPGVNLIAAAELARAPPVLREDGFVKTRLLATLAPSQRSQPIAEAVVRYEKRYSFDGYCMHRFRHARCYAADRPLTSLAQRMLAIFSTPVLPAVRTWRIFRNVRRQPSHTSAAWRYLHRILAAETCWALGELAGYLFGAGRARQRLR